MLKTGIKWCREALCYRTGTKLALVPGLKQPVLTGGGRMPLFLVVTRIHSSHLSILFSTSFSHSDWSCSAEVSVTTKGNLSHVYIIENEFRLLAYIKSTLFMTSSISNKKRAHYYLHVQYQQECPYVWKKEGGGCRILLISVYLWRFSSKYISKLCYIYEKVWNMT